MYGVAILPTGTTINPHAPESNEYHDRRDVDYILQKDDRTRPTRVASSAGDLGPAFAIGTQHRFYHDQTMAGLGYYTIVGIVDYSAGSMRGEVPNRKLSYSVFK